MTNISSAILSKIRKKKLGGKKKRVRKLPSGTGLVKGNPFKKR